MLRSPAPPPRIWPSASLVLLPSSLLLRRRHSPATSPQPPSAPQTSLFAPSRTVLVQRRAEEARFGLPVWKLLGLGFVGVCGAFRWWANTLPTQLPPPAPAQSIEAEEAVDTTAMAHDILTDVRRVFAKHGMGCGQLPLRVKLCG